MIRLIWTNDNPRPWTICDLCRPMIGTVWEPGTEIPLPLHPRCYCSYFPTDMEPEEGTQPPDVDSLDPVTRRAWVRYAAYLLRLGLVLVPWLLPLLLEAQEYNRRREEEDQEGGDSMPGSDPTPPTPPDEVPADGDKVPADGDDPTAVFHNPTSARTGRVLLSPAESDGRREYACSFMAAGRVKQADQQPSEWLIPAPAIQAAEALFSGRPSYLDHPDLFGFGYPQEPKVSRLIGVTFGARWDPTEQAMLGGLRLYDRAEGSPGWLVGRLFDQILEDKHKGLEVPPIGLSAVFYHTARLDEDSGLRITDRIDHIESVDLVYDPGAAGYVRDALAALRPRLFTVETDLAAGGAASVATLAPPPSAADDGHHISVANLETASPGKPPDPVSTIRNPRSAIHNQEVPMSETLTPQEVPTTEAPPTPSAAQSPLTGTPDATASRLSALESQLDRLTQAMTALAPEKTIQGVENPVRSMTTGLDQVAAAVEAMLQGIRPAGGIPPLSGIRELYTLLSGDYEMTGMFHPDRVYLANVNTSTMAGLVANALNKRVINQYQEYPRWWEPAVTEEDFATLQQIRWITLGGVGDLPTVEEGAAYTELTWDDQTETASFVKKGGYLGLTMEAIDKDDTRRLQAAPRALAQSAWLTLGKAIAALFTVNTGYGPQLSDSHYLFDSSNHANLGTTAFSHAAWVATKIAMMQQTELNSGERLSALTKPYLLWVPIDLEDAAMQEIAAGEGQIGTADYALNADALANALTDRLAGARRRVITVPFWTDANDWVAQADPRLYPGLGLGYRYGRTPEVYSVASPTAGLMFTNDTMPIKVRFFFACGPTDYRAWYKHKVS